MKGIGPFKERDFGGFDRPRALFSNMPIGISHLLDYSVLFDDFLDFTATAGTLTGTVSTTGTIVDAAAAAAACALSTSDMYTDAAVNSAVDTAVATAVADLEASTNLALKELATRLNKWLIIKDTSASVLDLADSSVGEVVLTSQATTDDNGASIQAIESQFLAVAGTDLWFEARVKVSDADQGEMFVGLAEAFATNPEAVIVNGIARIGFELIDGAATINCVVDDDTSPTREVLAISMSDATYVKLGFRLDGASIRYYVNRALVHTASLPTAIAAIKMGPAFMHISGNNTGTHTATIDNVLVVQER